MEHIEQPRGTLSFLAVLEGASGPFTYNGAMPQHLSLMFATALGGSGVGSYTVEALNNFGLHLITIPEAELLLLNEFNLCLYSETNSFKALLYKVVFSDLTIMGRFDAQDQAITTLATAIGTLNTQAMSKLAALVLAAEANTESSYTWNPAGTEISEVDVKFMLSDSSPNFDTPDRRVRITYERDAVSRRVTKKTVREIAL